MKYQDAQNIVIHEIAPTLTGTITGLFSVSILGIYRQHVEIAVNLVNRSGEILKQFGTQVLRQGNALVVDEYPSLLSVSDDTVKVEGYFQAWIIGVSANSAEAEIAIRLVDSDGNLLIDFGSMTKKANENITLNGMEIKLNIERYGK